MEAPILKNLLSFDIKTRMEVRHWRNTPHVTEYFQLENISEETHTRWLWELENMPDKHKAFVIIYGGGQSVLHI